VGAGTLVVASEGSGSIRAITPGGVQSVIATVASAEMVSFVPLNLGISGNPLEGFYAANYASNVIKAGAEQFLDYRGDMIITGETTHLVTRVRWNGSQFVNEQIGQFPGQPEDGIFVTAAILNPGCEITNSCGGNAVPEPSTLSLAWLGTALVGFAFPRVVWHPARRPPVSGNVGVGPRPRLVTPHPPWNSAASGRRSCCRTWRSACRR
jgi:hypothetical protein